VAVVGSANMDLVSRVDRFPLPGETVIGSDFRTFTGGKGANQACAIGKLGGNPAFVGKVGNDSFGMQITRALHQFGVDASNLLAEQNVATGTAMITVDASGENTIIVTPGANAHVDPDYAVRCLKTLEAKIALMQLEIPLATIQAVAMVAEVSILNPAPAAELPDGILERLAWITPNETETRNLTGIAPTDDESCLRAAAWFRNRGVANVVITLGSKGSYLSTSGYEGHCVTIPVQSVDSTAAGDAFNGALCHFLSRGHEPRHAVQIANCAGALATTKFGAQTSLPSLTELRAVAGALL
jgi:ribokinase